MPNYRTEDIRNIALIGQSSAGKTILAEALLLASGRIDNAGSIDKGTTVCGRPASPSIVDSAARIASR